MESGLSFSSCSAITDENLDVQVRPFYKIQPQPDLPTVSATSGMADAGWYASVEPPLAAFHEYLVSPFG